MLTCCSGYRLVPSSADAVDDPVRGPRFTRARTSKSYTALDGSYRAEIPWDDHFLMSFIPLRPCNYYARGTYSYTSDRGSATRLLRISLRFRVWFLELRVSLISSWTTSTLVKMCELDGLPALGIGAALTGGSHTCTSVCKAGSIFGTGALAALQLPGAVHVHRVPYAVRTAGSTPVCKLHAWAWRTQPRVMLHPNSRHAPRTCWKKRVSLTVPCTRLRLTYVQPRPMVPTVPIAQPLAGETYGSLEVAINLFFVKVGVEFSMMTVSVNTAAFSTWTAGMLLNSDSQRPACTATDLLVRGLALSVNLNVRGEGNQLCSLLARWQL